MRPRCLLSEVTVPLGKWVCVTGLSDLVGGCGTVLSSTLTLHGLHTRPQVLDTVFPGGGGGGGGMSAIDEGKLCQVTSIRRLFAFNFMLKDISSRPDERHHDNRGLQGLSMLQVCRDSLMENAKCRE